MASAPPTDSDMSTPASPAPSLEENDKVEKKKERNRVAERKSRLKRQENHKRMAAQVHALECVLANLMFLDKDGDARDSGLMLTDDESKRVREFLRRMAPLEAEKVQLASEQHELKQLLKDREAFEDVFRSLVQEMNKETDWDWRVMRWRALTLASFEPWPVAKCDAVVEEALEYISEFMAKDDVVTTGLTFLGWRDRRRMDASVIEFIFYKTSYGDAAAMNDALWQLHRPGKAYADTIVGHNAKVYTEIIQEFDENRCLVRLAEQYPNSPVVIHQVVLLMRVYVDDACYIIRRSVSAPEVQAAIDDADAVWTSVNYWTSHLVLERNSVGTSTKYLCSTCGTIASDDQKYAVFWLSEVLFSVIRGETWVRGGHPLLQ